MTTHPSGQLSSDISMETLQQELENIRRSMTTARAAGNPTLDTSDNPFHRRPKSTAAKVQYFSNSPGENFLSWRSQFQVIATLNEWTNAEAKSMAFAYMKGHALDTVLDISIKEEDETLTDLLEKYQSRFLPSSRSQMLRAQFHCIMQLPNESIQRLHARMRVLYNLAYPDVKDRSDVFLTERFVAALNNREVQNHVRRRKPTSFDAALEIANEETSFVLMDLATHAPGGLQQPLPGDSSYIATLRGAVNKSRTPNRNFPSNTPTGDAKKQCFYCEADGHFRNRCPLRLRDLLTARRSRPAPGRNGTKSNTTFTTKKVAGYSPAARRQARSSAEARQTLPFVTDGYGKGQVAAISEEGEEDQDVLGDVDWATLDEPTVAALYNEFVEEPLPEEEEEEDFPEGQ